MTIEAFKIHIIQLAIKSMKTPNMISTLVSSFVSLPVKSPIPNKNWCHVSIQFSSNSYDQAVVNTMRYSALVQIFDDFLFQQIYYHRQLTSPKPVSHLQANPSCYTLKFWIIICFLLCLFNGFYTTLIQTLTNIFSTW